MDKIPTRRDPKDAFKLSEINFMPFLIALAVIFVTFGE